MTNLQMFNKVKRHLLKQNKQSISFIGEDINDDVCLYRNSDGLKCAIGCLIPDNRYSKELEGRSLYVSKSKNYSIHTEHVKNIMEAAGLTQKNLALAVALQELHDNFVPSEWATELKTIKRAFRL